MAVVAEHIPVLVWQVNRPGSRKQLRLHHQVSVDVLICVVLRYCAGGKVCWDVRSTGQAAGNNSDCVLK